MISLNSVPRSIILLGSLIHSNGILFTTMAPREIVLQGESFVPTLNSFCYRGWYIFLLLAQLLSK